MYGSQKHVNGNEYFTLNDLFFTLSTSPPEEYTVLNLTMIHYNQNF